MTAAAISASAVESVGCSRSAAPVSVDEVDSESTILIGSSLEF